MKKIEGWRTYSVVVLGIVTLVLGLWFVKDDQRKDVFVFFSGGLVGLASAYAAKSVGTAAVSGSGIKGGIETLLTNKKARRSPMKKLSILAALILAGCQGAEPAPVSVSVISGNLAKPATNYDFMAASSQAAACGAAPVAWSIREQSVGWLPVDESITQDGSGLPRDAARPGSARCST